MTETRTLQFENARAVQSLYAHDLKLIKNLEESLGVKVTTREGWIKVEGEPAQVEKAEQVFTQLENARQRGVDIQRHEFNYALNSVNEARADNLGDLVCDQDHDLVAQAADRAAHPGPAKLHRGDPET